MTNAIALALAALILALAVADAALGWGLAVTMGRILSDVIHWLAFWR